MDDKECRYRKSAHCPDALKKVFCLIMDPGYQGWGKEAGGGVGVEKD